DGYRVGFGFDQQIGTNITSATFNGSGQLTVFNASQGAFDLGTGTHADFGTDGILAWGRWVGTVTANSSPQTYSGNQGVHYVIGLPTAVMPTSGTATYTLLGATSPTYVDGAVSPGTFSGVLAVDFGGALRTPAVDMTLGVGIGGRTYAVVGTAFISSGVFSGNPTVTDVSGACGSGCTASVQGFFAGPSAERAGLGYHINDSIIKKDIVGAAAFAKQ
ncbi:MAG: hypothetical protein ACREUX_09645, partial [Burkholderiales bacterium]